jgi:predicted Fe-S protein YdhL (DUF1289 family)
MAIERWELLLSSKPDRYLLKIRGDRQDVEKIIRDHERVCHGPEELQHEIFQWVVYVVDATMNERLSIQNQLCALSSQGEDISSSLASVLDELTGVLEGLTGLTAEEEAHVIKKVQQIQERESRQTTKAVPRPAPPRQMPPAPPPPWETEKKPSGPIPSFSPPDAVAPPAARPPASKEKFPPPPRPSKPVPPKEKPAPPEPVIPFFQPEPSLQVPPELLPPLETPPLPPAKPAEEKPEIAPEPNTRADANEIILNFPEIQGPAVPPPPAETPPTPGPVIEPPFQEVPFWQPEAAPPASAEPAVPPVQGLEPPYEGLSPAPVMGPPSMMEPKSSPSIDLKLPEEQVLRAAVFYTATAETVKQKFITTLTDIAQKKAKKPIYVQMVLTQASKIGPDRSTDWVWSAKSAGADCFFVILPPDVLPDNMEPVIIEARQASLHCFLVPQGEIVSRLLYVDLMVEMMLIKRKR